ncbi:ATP-binding protein [Streptomyces sp. B1I3]|uniref:ATP-binding protein n=1 Tax=Streptomyces sp. B1I3 TaxID=3042264 RepID=UPI00278B78D0|nr:ATP-binding protein [Streptomyces sp. B1I3]MDQ0792611.1 serine/threonine-protein kinase RsbW [Streptomyces sp. B1I3]
MPDQTDRPIARAERTLLSLPATPSAVRRGRDHVRDTLRSWGLVPDDEPASAAALIASELLTNAVRHAGGPLVVCLDLDGDRLILEVHDTSPELPGARRGPLDTCAEDGRGLTLVDAYSHAHGAERTATGKRCWAVLTLPPGALPGAPRAAGYMDVVRWVAEPAGVALLAEAAEVRQAPAAG